MTGVAQKFGLLRALLGKTCTNMPALPGDINRGCINTLFWSTSKLLNLKRSALSRIRERSIIWVEFYATDDVGQKNNIHTITEVNLNSIFLLPSFFFFKLQ